MAATLKLPTFLFIVVVRTYGYMRQLNSDQNDRAPIIKSVELLKFPYPYEAALTVASDIDNASFLRFAAIHSLLCGRGVIRPGSLEWETLGLTPQSAWYDPAAGGVCGLGFDFADSFFLIGDNVSMGMYRETLKGRFVEDNSDGYNAAEGIRSWLKSGQIDSFHSFLHYSRDHVLPILEAFYRWCEIEGVTKPSVWLNHSIGVTPTGLCPQRFRPNRIIRLARQIARAAIGPICGRGRSSFRDGLTWYAGATPGSKFYINDVLAANGLRYVWLNSNDVFLNRIALPERFYGNQSSILDVVTMDDGVKYYRFPRCCGVTHTRPGMGYCLRQSEDTCDTSSLFTRENIESLCRNGGTCILYTHWTLARSFPISDESIGHFHLVQQYRDAGRLWSLPLSKLLEWTILRTFLKFDVHEDEHTLVIDIQCVDDPVFGLTPVTLNDLHGLSFRVIPRAKQVKMAIAGQPIEFRHFHCQDGLCKII